jgi:hypothetical protein
VQGTASAQTCRRFRQQLSRYGASARVRDARIGEIVRPRLGSGSSRRRFRSPPGDISLLQRSACGQSDLPLWTRFKCLSRRLRRGKLLHERLRTTNCRCSRFTARIWPFDANRPAAQARKLSCCNRCAQCLLARPNSRLSDACRQVRTRIPSATRLGNPPQQPGAAESSVKQLT